MQAIANKEGANITIEPWDYRFYAEKVRKAKYDLDSNEVKEYLQLEKLREAMIWAAGKLYGFEFLPVSDVPVFHPDVRVWEVKRNGRHIGLWYFDPYARQGKRSGAWMSDYRSQQRMDGEVTTIVSNNANFVKGAPGEPVLISWDDAETMFHEFGHALHGLASDVTYPSLSGTEVARDYVELPSQINEHWLSTPEVLNRFALHYKTGKAIPKELVEKIDKASKFNQGFATTEFLASALVDMKLHTLAEPGDLDPDRFERETLAALGMPKELPMRHRMPSFRTSSQARATPRDITRICGRMRSLRMSGKRSLSAMEPGMLKLRRVSTTTCSAKATRWIRPKLFAPSAGATWIRTH